MLPEDQVQFFKDNGYLIIENFLSEQACQFLVAEAEFIAQGHHTNILNLHRKAASYHGLITNKEILQLADQLQGARMIPIGSIFFFCKPDNPLEQGSHMHQDNYAAKAPYGSYLAVGCSFDHTDERNGGLIVYPGSHKLGDLPNTPSKNFEHDKDGKICKVYPIGNETEIPEDLKPLQLIYPRGSLLFLHSHILHGAPKNPSKIHWRRKVYLHYIKDGDPFWPGWNSRRALVDRDGEFQI